LAVEEGRGDGEQGEEGQEEEIVVWKGPVTPRPWESLGSEIEVDDEKTVENRAKVIELNVKSIKPCKTKHRNYVSFYG
jgi:hypothetical protein